MPILTSAKSANGAIITASIWPSRAGLALISNNGAPKPQPVIIQMLIDTGADQTAVDESIMLQWALPHSGVAWARAYGNVNRFPIRQYELDIKLSGQVGQIPWQIEHWMVTARPNSFHGAAYQGLIGRDVLDRAMFIYSGHLHEWTLSY